MLEHDLIRAEMFSLPLTILVLIRVFRSWVAAVIPVVVGGLAVVAGVAAMLCLSHFTDRAQNTISVPFFKLNLAAADVTVLPRRTEA